MSPDELDRLQALCDAATPGPWVVDGPGAQVAAFGINEDSGISLVTAVLASDAWIPHSDAEFCAEARQVVPALIEEVRSLRDDYFDACQLVADMHAEAVGEVRGPDIGPVEDIAKLRAENESLKVDIAEYREQRDTYQEQYHVVSAERDALREQNTSLKNEMAKLVLATEKP